MKLPEGHEIYIVDHDYMAPSLHCTARGCHWEMDLDYHDDQSWTLVKLLEAATKDHIEKDVIVLEVKVGEKIQEVARQATAFYG